MDLKKSREGESLRLARSVIPATNKVLLYGMSHAKQNIMRIALSCIDAI